MGAPAPGPASLEFDHDLDHADHPDRIRTRPTRSDRDSIRSDRDRVGLELPVHESRPRGPLPRSGGLVTARTGSAGARAVRHAPPRPTSSSRSPPASSYPPP